MVKKKPKEKTIDTLLSDVDELFTKNTVLPDELIDQAAQQFREVLKDRFSTYGEAREQSKLRLSQVGKDLRLLYLENLDDEPPQFPPHILRLFLFGDILEILMILFAKATGHKVKYEQHEVTLNGVKGHIDCIIDGTLVDIKSASGRGFEKFLKGDILTGNDPYGYVGQLISYQQSPQLKGKISDTPAFWAFNKELGQMSLQKVFPLYHEDMSDKIDNIVASRKSDNIPPMCAGSEPVPTNATSGNKKVGQACTFCNYKWFCWEDLRAFKYANKTEYLCHVETEPRVPEVTHELRDKRKKFNRKNKK